MMFVRRSILALFFIIPGFGRGINIDDLRIGLNPVSNPFSIQYLMTSDIRYIQGEINQRVADNLIYHGSILFTNDDKHQINAAYEREDYSLFSTGKIYASLIKFPLSILDVSIGRIPLSPPEYSLATVEYGYSYLSYDGYSFRIDRNIYSVQFSGGMFLADSIEGYSNKYLFSHSITFHHNRWHISLGELMVSSEDGNSKNLTRFNPLIPYLFYAYEQYEPPRPNSEGDYDNLALVLGVRWDRIPQLQFKLIIDEYHIDGIDRDKFYDQYLAILAFLSQQSEYGAKNYRKVLLKLLIQSPAFGLHPGQSTDFYVRGNPIYDSKPGRTILINLIYDHSVSSTFDYSINVAVEQFIENYYLVDNNRVQHKSEFGTIEYYWQGTSSVGCQYHHQEKWYINTSLIVNISNTIVVVACGYYF